MKLSAPADMGAPGESASKETTAPRPEPTVEVPLGDGTTEEMAMSEAIRMHQEWLTDPEAFGIASNQSVRELRDRVEQLKRQNTELRRIVEMIHESQHNVAEYIGWDVDHSPIGWEEFD